MPATEQLWGASAAALAGRLAVARDAGELIAMVERFLRQRWPPHDPQVELVGRIVAALLRERAISRVDDVTDRFDITPRSLQRLFQRHVGVSPKWVLRRYRLHDAAAALTDDQAPAVGRGGGGAGLLRPVPFICDFSAAIGMTPVANALACRRRAAPVGA